MLTWDLDLFCGAMGSSERKETKTSNPAGAAGPLCGQVEALVIRHPGFRHVQAARTYVMKMPARVHRQCVVLQPGGPPDPLEVLEQTRELLCGSWLRRCGRIVKIRPFCSCRLLLPSDLVCICGLTGPVGIGDPICLSFSPRGRAVHVAAAVLTAPRRRKVIHSCSTAVLCEYGVCASEQSTAAANSSSQQQQQEDLANTLLTTTAAMPSYRNFYTNFSRFLGNLKRGVTHKAPAVTLPLSKLGLDLARLFQNLGLITSYNVLQKASRVKGHSRRWPAGLTPPSTTATQGFPGMYLRLVLNYNQTHPLVTPGGDWGSLLSPLAVPGPVTEVVKSYSRPSAHRSVSLQQLLSMRANKPPGIFLLSTPQGVLTDIEAELLGHGGVLLGYCGLPLVRVLQLRGLIKQQLHEQQAAAAEAGGSSGGFKYRSWAEWDPQQALGPELQQRLAPEGYAAQTEALLDAAELRVAEAQQVAKEARLLAREGLLQQAVWENRDAVGRQSREGAGEQQAGAGLVRGRVRRRKVGS